MWQWVFACMGTVDEKEPRPRPRLVGGIDGLDLGGDHGPLAAVLRDPADQVRVVPQAGSRVRGVEPVDDLSAARVQVGERAGDVLRVDRGGGRGSGHGGGPLGKSGVGVAVAHSPGRPGWRPGGATLRPRRTRR